MSFARIPELPPRDMYWTGPERVDLPPVAPPQMAPAPIPTPTLPSSPSPVLPTPGIDIADDFVFGGMALGDPGSPAEAFELLGYIPPSSPPARLEISCVSI